MKVDLGTRYNHLYTCFLWVRHCHDILNSGLSKWSYNHLSLHLYSPCSNKIN